MLKVAPSSPLSLCQAVVQNRRIHIIYTIQSDVVLSLPVLSDQSANRFVELVCFLVIDHVATVKYKIGGTAAHHSLMKVSTLTGTDHLVMKWEHDQRGYTRISENRSLSLGEVVCSNSHQL